MDFSEYKIWVFLIISRNENFLRYFDFVSLYICFHATLSCSFLKDCMSNPRQLFFRMIKFADVLIN